MASQLATDLQVVSGLATTQLDPLWAIENPDQLSAAVYEVLPPLVDQWALASSAVAADWYDAEREQANIDGTFRAIVEPLADLGTEALIAWATEPLRQDVPDLAAVKYRAVGGLQKRLANSANYTITGSSKADPQARGWMRTTRPGGCDFCKMVASRGAVYTEKTVRFACHEHCFCRAVPAWNGRDLPVEPYTPSEITSQLSRVQRKALNRQANDWIKANLE
jgi:hypothetical protein